MVLIKLIENEEKIFYKLEAKFRNNLSLSL